jgi:N-acetylglucosamine-6-phosphate deacetylase
VGRSGRAVPGAWAPISRAPSSRRPDAAPTRNSTYAFRRASCSRRCWATGPVVGVTIAPELPGALEVIGWLAARGILVALGHSDATAAVANAGFDAGARTVTHVFNAMSGLASRAPGLAGTALARADVAVQAIVDGRHLSAETAAVVVAAAGRRLVLVSDALAAAGARTGPTGWATSR